MSVQSLTSGTGAGRIPSRAPAAQADPAAAPPAAGTGSDGREDAAGRTFTVTLPPGLKPLSLNERLHWAERHRRYQSWKKAAWAMTLNAKLPRLARAVITAEYQPPDRRHRDGDNLAPTLKACLDGIVAAKVLPGDDARFVPEVTCRIGAVFPRGRLVLHVTEMPGAAS